MFELFIFELSLAFSSSSDYNWILHSAIWHIINVHINIYAIINLFALCLLLFSASSHFLFKLLEFVLSLLFHFFSFIISIILSIIFILFNSFSLFFGGIVFIEVQLMNLIKNLLNSWRQIIDLSLYHIVFLISCATDWNLNSDTKSMEDIFLIFQKSEKLLSLLLSS